MPELPSRNGGKGLGSVHALRRECVWILIIYHLCGMTTSFNLFSLLQDLDFCGQLSMGSWKSWNVSTRSKKSCSPTKMGTGTRPCTGPRTQTNRKLFCFSSRMVLTFILQLKMVIFEAIFFILIVHWRRFTSKNLKWLYLNKTIGGPRQNTINGVPLNDFNLASFSLIIQYFIIFRTF